MFISPDDWHPLNEHEYSLVTELIGNVLRLASLKLDSFINSRALELMLEHCNDTSRAPVFGAPRKRALAGLQHTSLSI